MIELRQLTKSGNVKLLEYAVEHNNGTTTLEQKLYIEKTDDKWSAKIDIADFPNQACAKDAAHKLGDWLVRLGQSIKDENKQFESIEL